MQFTGQTTLIPSIHSHNSSPKFSQITKIPPKLCNSPAGPVPVNKYFAYRKLKRLVFQKRVSLDSHAPTVIFLFAPFPCPIKPPLLLRFLHRNPNSSTAFSEITMETPSSIRRVTRSQTLAAANSVNDSEPRFYVL